MKRKHHIPPQTTRVLSPQQLHATIGGSGNISGGKAPPEPQPHI
jgi:hypothetical protein